MKPKNSKTAGIAILRSLKHQRGFALVITLTLMVLLTILALGMLSLSSVALRSMSRTDSMAVARANALLALQIAIADLQTHTGSDQRITAPGGVVSGATPEQQMITGVWDSNKLGTASSSSDFTAASKAGKFRKWLVSGNDAVALKTQSFVATAPPTGKDGVELVSPTSGSPAIGTTPATPPMEALRVAKVRIKTSTAAVAAPTGSYAYAVLDEGLKARVNLGTQSPAGNFASKSTALGSGQRPTTSYFAGLQALAPSDIDLDTPAGRSLTAKMLSNANSGIAYNAAPGVMKDLIHDVTTSSLGVLVDVANGGLKRDFNLLAEKKATGGLPTEYAGKNIYQQSLGASVISDPSWERALAWGGIFFNNSNFSKKNVGGTNVPVITASAPPGWSAGLGISSSGGNVASASLSLAEAPGPVLLPSIAKIQMSFALAARDIYRYSSNLSEPPKDARGGNTLLHQPWSYKSQENINIPVPAGSTRAQIAALRTFDSPYDYLLHMVFSPIITLHNPYNVPISFEKMRVEFVNVPFAFQVFKNGAALQKSPVPFAVMYSRNNTQNLTKRFGLTLSDTLLPGEVKVYSPSIPPDRTWLAEVTTNPKVFWDHNNTNEADGRTGSTATDTSLAEGIAGWNGVSVGYDLDNLCPPAYRYTDQLAVAGTSAVIDSQNGIPLRKSDTIFVKSAPIPDPAMEKKFSVEMTLQSGIASKSRSTILLFEFNAPNDIQDVTMTGNPQAETDNTIRAPKGSDFWTTDQLFDHSTVGLRDIANTRPFALFSAYAKTTRGGDSNGEEGLWASKPFSFQNHTSAAISQNIKSGHPSHYSHELALSRFSESSGIGIQAVTNRGRFITGHSAQRGRHFGTMFDVPLAPFQSFASLNSAQLASSAYLPHFTNPVGNSYAHPTITTQKVIADGAAGYKYADHSFLLNAALFDSYYFSGFQSHAPVSLDGDGISASTLISKFLGVDPAAANSPSPLPDPRLTSYLPDGETPTVAAGLLNGNDGYLEAAAHQLVAGAFNVNSVSKPAWRAVLASMSGEDAMALVNPSTSAAVSILSQTKIKDLPAGEARFSRFRIPNGDVDRNDADAFWRSPVDLTSTQIAQLADEIVEQVRTRGPFLSMAEFVNRQIGLESDTKAQSGAIQAAIDKVGINSSVATSVGGGVTIASTETGTLMLANPKALEGDSAQGAPGYLMQSDVLAVLGNTATVRSDTFKIRAYGEALDKNSNITARVFCEAIVQRLPDYVDSQNKASAAPAALNATNQVFGRRFKIVSLSWLSPGEI